MRKSSEAKQKLAKPFTALIRALYLYVTKLKFRVISVWEGTH